MALISQDYWGNIKEDWRSGGPKSRRSPPAGSMGRAPVGGGGEVPQKLKLFCETKHNSCIKKQQLLLLLDKINDITSKILGDITIDPPS